MAPIKKRPISFLEVTNRMQSKFGSILFCLGVESAIGTRNFKVKSILVVPTVCDSELLNTPFLETQLKKSEWQKTEIIPKNSLADFVRQ